jgi:hypothetical protein
MPRLPDAQSLGQRPVPQSRQGVATNPRAGAVGDAVAGLGQAIAGIGQQQLDQQDKFALSTARASYLKADIAARAELENDPDYGTYQSRYAEKMKAAQGTSAAMLRNKSDRAMFELDATTDFARGSAEVHRTAQGKQVVADKATLYTGLKDLHDVSRGALDQETRAAAIKTAGEMIAGAKARGTVDPLAAVTLQEGWANDYATEQATMALNREDPAGAQAVLDQFGDKMDFKSRLGLEARVKGVMDFRQSADDFAGATGAANIVSPTGGTSPSVGSMVSALRTQESGGKQFAANGKPLTSSKGAVGVMQVMPTTGPEAAKLAGVPWDANKLAHDAAYNQKLGEAYFGEMLRQFKDPVAAAAAYNAGPGRVKAAIAKGGDWLSRLPAETQDYVDKFKQRTGAQQESRRWDKEAVYAAIDKNADAGDWTIERRERAKGFADTQISRDEQLQNRQEEAGWRSALDTVDHLGDGFQDVSQIPNFNSLPPERRLQLEGMAEQRRKPKTIEANGDAIVNLHQLVYSDPDAFIKKDLRAYRDQLTPGEYDEVLTLQSKMAASPKSPDQISHSRIWQFATFYGRDAGVDMSAKKDGEKPAAFTARRKDGMALFTIMQNYLRAATEGKRQPTEDEFKRAYDNAVMPVPNAEGKYVPRFRVSTLPTNSVAIPTALHDRLRDQLKSKGLAYDDQSVARAYLKAQR